MLYFIIFGVIVFAVAIIAGIVNGIRQGKQARQQSPLKPSAKGQTSLPTVDDEAKGTVIKSTAPKVIYHDDLATVSMSTQFSVRDVQISQKTEGMLQPVSIEAFSGYVSPSGGYVNYGRFQVTGINPATKRKNKRTYEEFKESYASQRAKIDGLEEPFEIITLPSIPPSERQIAYAHDLGISIPDGACMADVSALISRVTDDDEAPAPEGIAEQAHIYGVKFSRYSGRKEIMRKAKDLSRDDYREFLQSI